MNIDHARYFLVLTRTQHILKAAKLLGISSTAISHGITKLEAELGIELTHKAGRNIVITDKGIEFSRKIEKILREIDLIKSDLSGEVISEGLYKMGLTHGLAALLFGRSFGDQIEDVPGVSCEISSLRSADVIASVLNGSIDLGICYSPQEHPNVSKKILHTGRLVFAANKIHPVFKAKSLEQKVKILNGGFAIGAKAFQGIDNCENHPAFNKLKIKPNYKYIVDSYETKIAILKKSNAWAFVPEIILSAHSFLKEINMVEYSAPYTIEAVWNKARKPLLLYQNILNLIEKNFQTLR